MVHYSNVYRGKKLAAEGQLVAGINPCTELAPRQINIDLSKVEAGIPASIKKHRGSAITTVSAEAAAQLVDEGSATYMTQSILCYSMSDYLSDKDVLADGEELAKAKSSGFDLVVVAIIGDNRSALAVCRNIVSGCQKPEKLVADAEGAMASSSVFLIED